MQSCHRAWTSGDVEQAMTYIADDITVKDGRITDNVLIFDRLSYGPPQG